LAWINTLVCGLKYILFCGFFSKKPSYEYEREKEGWRKHASFFIAPEMSFLLKFVSFLVYSLTFKPNHGSGCEIGTGNFFAFAVKVVPFTYLFYTALRIVIGMLVYLPNKLTDSWNVYSMGMP